MRIAVVAYEMEGSRTGVGRYLDGLLSGLAEVEASEPTEWVLFFKGDPFTHPLFAPSSRSHRFLPRFDHRPRARPILWEQLRLPRLLKREPLDLLFSPAYSLPRGWQGPSMVTIHDLSFEHLPQEFGLKERWRRRWLARRAARTASRVLVDTGEIARDMEKTYGVERERIGIVPLAPDPSFQHASASLDKLQSSGIRLPYVLFVGSILPRRQLDLVLDAFIGLKKQEPGLQLVLAGQNRLPRPSILDQLIQERQLQASVRHLGYTPDHLLPSLYQAAELSFYLSSYEGYGLPPLESLASGTPAVISPGQALDDVWPDYPFRSPSLAVEEVIETTLEAWRTRREDGWKQAADQHLATLNWRRSAELLIDEIEKARTSS